MHARIYVENYSREEGKRINVAAQLLQAAFCSARAAVSAIMTSAQCAQCDRCEMRKLPP